MLYTCPKCGLQTNVVEGKSLTEELCEHCGQPIGPLQDGSTQTSSTIEQPSSCPRKKGLRLLDIFVIVTIIGTLIGLLLPAINSGPRNGRRFQCMNNQRQIAIALFAYEAEKGHFPPAYIPDKNGKPMHSWRVLMLPYLGRKDLYEQYDFTEPWNGPHNQLLADKMPSIYRCPSNHDSPNCTGYAFLVGPHAFSPGPKGRTDNSFTDGLAITLMFVEAADAKINWLEPRDLNVEEMSFQINKDGKEISSHHPGIAVVSFCDGHQSFLPENIKPETLKALITVDGGEAVKPEDY
jgi:hypothetical protein